VLIQGAPGDILNDVRRHALIDDLEVFGKAHERRTLPHNVMGQAVKGAHPVADVGQQAALPLQDVGDAVAEVVDGSIGEGDDQHFAPVHPLGQPAGGQVFHQARGKVRQGERLAAAGDGFDAHLPAAIPVHDGVLLRTEPCAAACHQIRSSCPP